MFFSSIKEINRLISKRMSNIYLKVTIEKNWHSENFDFLSLKSSSPVEFLRSSNSRRYQWIFKLLVAIKKSEVWEQNCVRLFFYFDFERNYVVLKSKSPCFLLNKYIETESKKENLVQKQPPDVFCEKRCS